jgi:SAM-dependent methyltransferase/predicted transcriptional regulator
MRQNKTAEGDRIYDLYTGVYKPQIIRIALELDIFSYLNSRPANAEHVARACNCDALGIHHLLDYLTSLHILEREDDQYSLTIEAATFLVRGKMAYTGDLIMDFAGPAPWESIRESIRSGHPRNIDLDIHFSEDAWIESYRSLRIPSSLEMWTKVGIIPDASLQMRLLDLACGCAIKSMVLAKRSSTVEVTCLDTPLVLEVARDLAERWGILSQVHFLPGNLLTAELGEAKYDICLLGQITHYLTKQENCEIFSHIHKALIPRGKLVLDVPMETAQPDETSSFLSLMLWANSGGKAYKYEEYHSWLMESGFIKTQLLTERLLLAINSNLTIKT